MWFLCHVIQKSGRCQWVLRYTHSQIACLHSLREKQLEVAKIIPIKMRFVKKQTRRVNEWNDWIDLLTQLHAQLSSSGSLLNALQRINLPKQSQLQMFVEQTIRNIQRGYLFSQAFQNVPHTLPDVCVQLIQYSEQEHCLLVGIEKTIEILQYYHGIQVQLQRALFYPITVFVGLCLFFCIVLFFVIPHLQFFAGSDELSIWLSWVQNHPFVGCCGVVILCVSSILWIQRQAWKLFMRFSKWFHCNENLDYYRFAAVLLANLTNGQTLKTSFQKAQAFLPKNLQLNDQQWSHEAFIRQLPMPFQEVFDKSFLELTGSVQQLLGFYWDAYQQRLSQQLKFVEPACLLVITIVLIVGLILVFYPLVGAMHTLEFF